MFTRLRRLGPLLLATSIVGTSAARSDAFTVRGFVVDQFSEPVTAATITLDGADLGAVTDFLGNFELTGIPRGTYGLHVREGCEAVAFVPEFSVPRPLNVPYPVVAHRLDFTDPAVPTALSSEDQAALISEAFTNFVKDERRVLADAFLADGVVRLFALNASIPEIARGERLVTLRTIAPGGDGPAQVNDPIPIQVWLGVKDGRALVHILRATPALPDELDLFLGDRALFVFERGPDGWTTIDQLYCIQAESRIAEMETDPE